MKRITPEMCLAAYEKTGAVPIRGESFRICDGKVECCGSGVILLADGMPGDEDAFHEETKKRFGKTYALGFWCAFDQSFVDSQDKDDRWNQGFEDGRACAAAVFAH